MEALAYMRNAKILISFFNLSLLALDIFRYLDNSIIYYRYTIDILLEIYSVPARTRDCHISSCYILDQLAGACTQARSSRFRLERQARSGKFHLYYEILAITLIS